MINRFSLHRAIPAALACALATLLAACGGPPIPLTGTVTDAYTGKPIPGALVNLGSTRHTADTNGQYTVDRWTTKDVLQVSADGYEPASIDLSTRPDLAKPQPPVVSLDTAIRPNTLGGIVRDSYTRQPLAGALVQVSETISTTTSADGRYALRGVPEQFTLSVSAPTYEPIRKAIGRTTSFDTELRPNVLSGVITDRYTGGPVAGATVKAGNATATTSAEGRYRLEGVGQELQVQVTAPGYAELTQTASRVTTLDLVLRPDTIAVTLLDAESGEPVQHATMIATTSMDSSDVAFARIDNRSDGRITLEGVPEQGFIQVLAPGYRKTAVEIKPGSVPTEIRLEPFYARGIYVTAAVASNWDLLMEYFDLIDRTELNAIVIDLKSDLRDDLGLIYYDSQVPIVKELGTARPYMDLPKILAEAKRRGIYTIARVHIFSHDNVLADARPEWAARDRTTGEVFADYPGPGIRYAWLDPWNENVWDYNIQLSVEAALMGFDEINYDYIRFPSLEFDPSDQDRLQLSKEDSTPAERYANIAQVLERSQRAINGAGAFLSIDVFGYTAWRPDPLIGQNLQILSKHVDYVMPMIYPSHFLWGELGFDNPAEHPYEIIMESVLRGAKQIAGNRAMQRPWLQDFTLTWVPQHLIVLYTPDKVRAQIKAVEDHGVDAGWVLYDSANNYSEEALQPER